MSTTPLLAAVPAGGWKKCRGCEQLFAELPLSGYCPRCEDLLEREQEIASLPERREKLLRRCRVPGRYADTAFVEPSPWPVDDRGGSIATWNGEPWSLTLGGDVGTGKTMLAVELLWRDLVRCRRSSTKGKHLFVRGADAVRIAFDRDGSGDFDQLIRVRFLVLDDLGAGISGEAWAALDRLIGPRYDERRPTIITTNLGAGDLANVHDSGARLADRLSDGLWAHITGDSRRGWTATRS